MFLFCKNLSTCNQYDIIFNDQKDRYIYDSGMYEINWNAYISHNFTITGSRFTLIFIFSFWLFTRRLYMHFVSANLWLLLLLVNLFLHRNCLFHFLSSNRRRNNDSFLGLFFNYRLRNFSRINWLSIKLFMRLCGDRQSLFCCFLFLNLYIAFMQIQWRYLYNFLNWLWHFSCMLLREWCNMWILLFFFFIFFLLMLNFIQISCFNKLFRLGFMISNLLFLLLFLLFRLMFYLLFMMWLNRFLMIHFRLFLLNLFMIFMLLMIILLLLSMPLLMILV